MDEFKARSRISEARSKVRRATALAHGGPLQDALTGLMKDLAWNLAQQRTGDEEETFHFILRCMGELVRECADDVYEPYGHKNPFAPAKEAWPWPVIQMPPTSSGGAFNADLRPYSALKMFGYTVGATEGWPKDKRQRFLQDFMERDLPRIVFDTFGDEYGKPLSTDRLRKVANVIAGNASNFWRLDSKRYAVAIDDWESDLAFLKAKYYEGRGLKFLPWPSSRPL
jgi:hypothetical protein